MRLGWLAFSMTAVAMTACVADEGSEPDQFGTCPVAMDELYNPQLKKQLDGANGTFVDECNEDGNLVEYACGTEPVYEGYEILELFTDEVVPTTIDCGGTCVDGRCPSQCPAADAALIYLEVHADGSIVIQDLATGAQLVCESTNGCTAAFEVGAAVDIAHTWKQDALCIPARPGRIKIAGECFYSCVVRQ